MTMFEIATLVVSAGGLTGLIVSLWFNRRALRMTAEAALDVLFVTVTEAYISHPQLRALFNEDEAGGPLPDLGDEDRLRANALAETLADAMERALLLQHSGLPLTGVGNWIEDSIRNSAFYRGWLRSRARWYEGPLIALLDRVEEDLSSVGRS